MAVILSTGLAAVVTLATVSGIAAITTNSTQPGTAVIGELREKSAQHPDRLLAAMYLK